MSEPEGVPSPSPPSADGTQKADTGQLTVLPAATPFDPPPLVGGLTTIAGDFERSFGGPVVSKIIVATLAQLSSDLRDAKTKVSDLETELNSSQKASQTLRERNAVLEERQAPQPAAQILRNLAITGGTAVVFAGVELFQREMPNFAWAAVVLGAALVIVGWASSSWRAGR